MHNFGHQNKLEFEIQAILTAGRLLTDYRADNSALEKTMHL